MLSPACAVLHAVLELVGLKMGAAGRTVQGAGWEHFLWKHSDVDGLRAMFRLGKNRPTDFLKLHKVCATGCFQEEIPTATRWLLLIQASRRMIRNPRHLAQCQELIRRYLSLWAEGEEQLKAIESRLLHLEIQWNDEAALVSIGCRRSSPEMHLIVRIASCCAS